MVLLLEMKAIFPGLLLVALMLMLSKQRKLDIALVALALPIAILFEFLMVQVGLLSFKVDPLPLWLCVLWMALLLTINSSMTFLINLRRRYAIALCAIFAPASYVAGARFDVLSIDYNLLLFWPLYGVFWALMFNGIIFINQRLKKSFEE